jgi:hypothetical protein
VLHTNKLKSKIIAKRKELKQLKQEKNSFSNPQVIKKSQQLDKLIAKYQELFLTSSSIS